MLKNGIKGCSLPRRGQHGGIATLELANFCGDVIIGWILQASIKISAGFQIKELPISSLVSYLKVVL